MNKFNDMIPRCCFVPEKCKTKTPNPEVAVLVPLPHCYHACRINITAVDRDSAVVRTYLRSSLEVRTGVMSITECCEGSAQVALIRLKAQAWRHDIECFHPL